MSFSKKLMAVLLSAVLLLSACGQAEPESVPTPAPPAPPASVSEPPKPEPEPAPLLSQSQSPESVSAAEPSAPSASEPPAPALPWWKAGLDQKNFVSDMGCGDGHADANYYDNVSKVSYSVNESFSQLSVQKENRYYNFSLLTQNAKEVTDIGTPLPGNPYFELVALDNTKYVGTMYERGVALTQSLPNKDKGTPVLLEIAEADYKQLQDNLTAEVASSKWAHPAWLVMMRQSRCVSATITGSNGKHTTTYTGNPDDPDAYLNLNIILDLQEIPVKPYSEMVPADTKLPGALTVKIDFSHGVSYHIQLTETELIVASSDLTEAVKYQTLRDSSFQSLNGWAEERQNPRTGKPVIYLYPEQPTDCTVTVDYPFSYTYPAYNGGWNVTAHPDGRLVNKSDNSEHYYLFWEGNKRIDWKFDSGFVVAGADTQTFLLEKLPALGLTPREYNDFITYWVPRMQDNAYNLITFAGGQYEQLAPLTVTPQPDSILRVHMVYKPLDTPVEIPEQQLTPFTRRGFTVVEWGGTEAD